ncbi:MAG: MBL fold metallo-hydrolase [Planctomycetota bacterium]|nr:MAG: MBL fold metallo-hydrolase [Planctomycetota bacterium]
MIVEQFYLACLSQASYLVGDPASGAAVVVDPRRDVEVYLEAASAHGLRVEHVVLTHFHADFLAGHIELRERAGATIYLGARAEAEYEFVPLADGDELRLSSQGVTLRVLETPGHTPEGISLTVYERPDAARPHGVFTGDTLFVGDVGRPDLMASVGIGAEELAESLYDSLHRKLLALPDETTLYPGHGPGSACGKSLGPETVSTIGQQRRFNYALQPMSREAFVRLVAAGQPPAPAYFGYDARLNRKERPTLDAALAAAERALDLEAVRRLANQGAQLLDVRDPEDFAAGHLPGSVNVGLGGRFAGWAGAVLDPLRPIVLLAPPGREGEAAVRLARVGFDRVVGHLAGGPGRALSAPGVTAGRVRRYEPRGLREALASSEPPHVLDVRAPGEHAEARIEGSQLLPLPELPGRLAEVPRGAPIVVHCRSGYRSMVAASLLARAGHDVADLRGGILAWGAAVD